MLTVPDTDGTTHPSDRMSRTASAISTPRTNATPSRRPSELPLDAPDDQPKKRPPSTHTNNGEPGAEPTEDDETMLALQDKLNQISAEDLTSQVNVLEQHEIEYRKEVERKKQEMKEELLDRSKVPESYYTTSTKEGLVLQFVENFNRQYMQLYPGRKELLLCPKNHFDTKKFVCTTIRATQLPYKELYDYRGCARFVADYISYEPLEPPHELPTTIPGPAYTLKLQYGNSFDYAIVLASLLRGVGYDAYVVSGYATRDLTLMNETKTETDAIGIPSPTNQTTSDAQEQAEKGEKEGGGTGKYKVKPPRQLRSSFLVKQEEKKKAAQVKDAEVRRLQQRQAMEEDDEDDDELKGLRVHAWVLVLPGKREVAESFFIEPPTGRIYPTDNENYLGVESVWSSANYWVNMQVCYDGLKGISFDLGDNAKWEFVLLDNTQPSSSANLDDEDLKDADAASDEEDETQHSEILDLPPSWVEKIAISKEQFEARCPSGSKSVTYKNARCETFAEYHRNDGMVSRITFFADDIKEFNGEIREYFSNRKDKLRERIRIPYLDKIHEFFDPGRPHGLKEHVILEGRTQEMHFYSSARSDGLVKRVEEPHKVIEIFTEREDFLTYRSVTYDTNDTDDLQLARGSMIKMTEKFDHDPGHMGTPVEDTLRQCEDVPAGTDAAKKTYFVKDDKIRVTYHREEGRIIPSTIEFKKPTAEQKNHFEVLNSFQVNPYTPEPKKQHLFAHLCALVRSEQACLNAIKLSEREVKEILQARQAEEKDVALVISVYDTIRNQTKLPSEDEKAAHKGEEEESKGTDLDYLSPFLVNYPDPTSLTPTEATQIKDACLKSLKERLIEKASIIQTRLDTVTAEYQRRQLLYSRNADSMTVEETEEYVRFCNDALFRMHILEKRLAKHKEVAPERYVELDAKLRADPRLRAAYY
ncbi:hypothetical protein HK097_008025 [Rhizophlyctis rosea]|uniref:Dynein regulatory complex subunit 7 n=1 Tax=Rhizophlyctis rosea TaxID=64517 RepID=A0AAD5SIN7_9FUNG|nr:hypothetical protein HK097_008025 [Rhizophlyctis rosea]